MIGQTLSHYRIIERLGQGGMGVVYLAEDTVLGRRVAIKTLTDLEGPSSKQFRSRFLREARAVSALSHPHIATVHDYGETPEGQPFIVMEYVKGAMLSDLIQSGSLSISRSLEIIIDVAEALAEAHRLRIVHRDIKPSNVAINDRGEVKVLDFGLAKQLTVKAEISDPEAQTLLNTQTRDGVVVGTPMYLSPEQAMGQPVDARSDLFALGSLLYECVAGTPPFTGPSPVEICAKIIRDDPSPPSKFNSAILSQLDEVTLKLLAKKPEHRYQKAEEAIEELRSVQESLKDHSNAHRLTQRLRGPSKRGFSTISDIFTRPRVSVGYVAIGFLIVSLALIGVWYARWANRHEPKPEALQFYIRGVAAMRDGSYLTASKQLRLAVEADPQFVLAHARLAETWTELDYADRAKDELLSIDDSASSGLSEAESHYLKAVKATVRREFPTAIHSYGQLAKLSPKNAVAHFDLGRAYESNEEVDKAISSFEQALTLDPNAAAAHLRLGILYFRKLDTTRGNTHFDKAAKLYQDSTNFEGNAEVLFQRGTILKQHGQWQQAQELLGKSFEIARIADDNSQQIRSKLQLSGVAYAEGNTAEAKQFASEAVELARANEMENLATQGLLDLGYAFFVARGYQDAELYFKQALDIAERNKGRRNQARAWMSLGALYVQQEQPEKGSPYLNRSLAFYREGQYRKEISQCLVWMGRSQLLKGEFESALQTFDEQFQLANQVDDPLQMARSQEELASALGKLDFYPQALIRYTESYQLYKTLNNAFHTAFCLLNRADMLARLGRYEEANSSLDELEPLLASLPSDNKYKSIWSLFSHVIRAQMALSERRLPEAKEACQNALRVIASENQSDFKMAEATIKEILGLVEAFSGAGPIGIKLCREAIELTSGAVDHAYGETLLAMAEVSAITNDAKSALHFALKAQQSFSSRHRQESEWRAWLIAARASHQLQDPSSRDQAANAKALLEQLQHRWGNEAFDSYSARTDIATHRRTLNELL